MSLFCRYDVHAIASGSDCGFNFQIYEAKRLIMGFQALHNDK